jgi:uncharacterized damage-inducible protein DinB
MVSPETFQNLYHYNYWARDRQLEACAKVSPEQFVQPLGGSFGSLRDTLVHVAGAEWIWCERWNGRSPRTFPTGSDFPSLESIEQYWNSVEVNVRRFVGAVTEERLREALSYINVAGEQWTYPLWQTLFHLVNHGTYHRGQVTTLLRQLGAQAAHLDYLLMFDVTAQAGGR